MPQVVWKDRLRRRAPVRHRQGAKEGEQSTKAHEKSLPLRKPPKPSRMNNPKISNPPPTDAVHKDPVTDKLPQKDAKEACISLAESVNRLKHKLNDSKDLMPDMFYLNILIEADGDIELAKELLERNEPFDLVDAAILEDALIGGSSTVVEMVRAIESPPAALEGGTKYGSWRPRLGPAAKLTSDQKGALRVFADLSHLRTTDSNITIDYLESTGWQVAVAFAQWEADRSEAMGRTPKQGQQKQDSRLLQTLMSSGIPFNENLEQERRDTARVFRDATTTAASSSSSSTVSISEAVLLLHIAGWDLAKAFAAYIDRTSAHQVLTEPFDRMRAPTDDRVHQDERLAILLTITQRPDTWALETLLAGHNWNLIKAVVSWYKNGIRPMKHPKDQGSRKFRGWNRRKLPVTGDLCDMPTRGMTAVAKGDEQGWAKEKQEYATAVQARDRKREVPAENHHLGSIINDDKQPIQKGDPRPWKLQVESFWNGKYWQGSFRHKKYRWMDLDDADFMRLDDSIKAEVLKKPVFDWHNREHLEDLNKWRRQKFQRATADKIRPACQVFSEEEKQFLYDLSEEHINTMMQQTGKSRDECLLRAVPASVKKDWEKRFNDKFVGTMPAPHKKPIEPRNHGSLMTERSRIPEIRARFKIGQIGHSRKRARNEDEPTVEGDDMQHNSKKLKNDVRADDNLNSQ